MLPRAGPLGASECELDSLSCALLDQSDDKEKERVAVGFGFDGRASSRRRHRDPDEPKATVSNPVQDCSLYHWVGEVDISGIERRGDTKTLIGDSI